RRAAPRGGTASGRSSRSGRPWPAPPGSGPRWRLLATRARSVTSSPMADDHPVLVITGASSRIRAAQAHRAVEFGHRVVLAARSEDKLQGLAQELGGEERAIAV